MFVYTNYVRLRGSRSASGRRGHINISFRSASFKLFEPLKFWQRGFSENKLQ